MYYALEQDYLQEMMNFRDVWIRKSSHILTHLVVVVLIVGAALIKKSLSLYHLNRIGMKCGRVVPA